MIQKAKLINCVYGIGFFQIVSTSTEYNRIQKAKIVSRIGFFLIVSTSTEYNKSQKAKMSLELVSSKLSLPQLQMTTLTTEE